MLRPAVRPLNPLSIRSSARAVPTNQADQPQPASRKSLTVYRYVARRRFGIFATTTRPHSIMRAANPMREGREGTPMAHGR